MGADASHTSSSAAVSPDRQIWVNGELVPWADATVHLLAHSLQRGSLVFDYMSVYDTPRGPAVFRLDDHASRFLISCELVGLPLEQSAAEVAEAIGVAVRANPGATAVKVSAYLPSVEVDVVPLDSRVSLAVAAYDPVADIILPKTRGGVSGSVSGSASGNGAPRAGVRRDLRLWIEKKTRNRREDIVPPHAKVAANYVSPMTAKWKAKKAGYDEILLVDEEGHLAEGPTTNFFLVDREGVLCTPVSKRVLLGVTRSSVIELAEAEGFPVREVAMLPEAIDDAAELFMTGTSAGIWPVESVDGREVGDGKPGPVTRALRDRFSRVVSGKDPAYEHWLTYVNDDNSSPGSPGSRSGSSSGSSSSSSSNPDAPTSGSAS
jgi:branched-chain amino acid aminotransferase